MRHVFFSIVFLSGLFLLGISSCVSLSSEPTPSLSEITRIDMEKSLETRNLRDGFNSWSRARIRGDLPPGYLSDYASRLYGLFANSAVSDQSSDQNILKILGHAEDMLRFSADVRPAESMTLTKQLDIAYQKYVQGCLDKGLDQLALLYAIFHPTTCKDQVLFTRLLAVAKSIPNPWAIKQLQQIANPGQVVSSPSSPELEIDPAAILKACVTVWVDRGIKVDRGMGMADRVIGSAFFIEKDGYLLTNYHVISSEVDPEYKGFSRLYIRLGSISSEKIPAKVIGWDPVFDLALLKTELQAPALVPLSNEQGANSGTRVLAFGSPGGLDNTVTAGIVSAQGRRFLPMGEILQIDAPVNPGNSGGPLLTATGNFLGIVFAGIPQFQGVNFSVPAYWISSLLPQLFQGGKVQHPRLGIQLFEYRNEVRVSYVSPGSPAFQLGIGSGTIIKKINSVPVTNITDGYRILNSIMPGQLCTIEWIPAAKALLDSDPSVKPSTAMIMVDERPEHSLENHIKAGLDLKLLIPLFGMRVSDISASGLQVQLRVEEVIPGSTADESGFAAGDTVQVLNWVYDQKNRAAILQLNVARRSQGFYQQTMQLASYADIQDLL